jgi:hypothetical protein
VNWPQFSTSYTVDTVSTVSTFLHAFGPSTFAEFTLHDAKKNERLRDCYAE